VPFPSVNAAVHAAQQNAASRHPAEPTADVPAAAHRGKRKAVDEAPSCARRSHSFAEDLEKYVNLGDDRQVRPRATPHTTLQRTPSASTIGPRARPRMGPGRLAGALRRCRWQSGARRARLCVGRRVAMWHVWSHAGVLLKTADAVFALLGAASARRGRAERAAAAGAGGRGRGKRARDHRL
jgi:hypothetical protein